LDLPVAVDAMGGDRPPAEIVAGAVGAAERGVPVVLVGRAADLSDLGDLPLVEASEVIAMDDDPAQGVRRKKDASVVRAAELVRDGKAAAMVSAGNTGAAMAASLLRMGRIRGVKRPAIATALPIPGFLASTPTVLLDSGANAECQPEWLVQFAQMGSAYFRHRYDVAAPRIGLLSIGEESMKGNSLVKTVHELLADTDGLHFVGNVEGRDLLSHDVDVVVTDGFTGNVVLKTLEGAGRAVSGAFVAAMAAPAYRQAGEELAPVIDPLLESIDPETYGGAVLLGVDGVSIIAHGSSQAKAVTNAILIAAEMVGLRLVDELRSAIE
jgi:glycerol-3-phosphate acyltransferase PlsX